MFLLMWKMILFCSVLCGIFLLCVVNRVEWVVLFGIVCIVFGYGVILNKESCIFLICCFVCFSNVVCLVLLICFVRFLLVVFCFLVVIVFCVLMVIDFVKFVVFCLRWCECFMVVDGVGRVGGVSCMLLCLILVVVCWIIELMDWKVLWGVCMMVWFVMVLVFLVENFVLISFCLYVFWLNVWFIYFFCGIVLIYVGVMCFYFWFDLSGVLVFR